MIITNVLMVVLIGAWITYLVYHNQDDPKSDEN